MTLEDFDDLREVGEAPGQAVDFVDHHHVDALALDIRQEPLEGWPFHVSAGERGIVVVVADGDPAFGSLAHDVRLSRIPLGVDRVVLLLQALVDRLPGVDGAALPCRHHDDAHSKSSGFRNPKKTGPDHGVPAMSSQSTRVASVESLRLFSASPEAHHRLSAELRGGILQAPWFNALQPTPWITVAFPSHRGRRGCA